MSEDRRKDGEQGTLQTFCMNMSSDTESKCEEYDNSYTRIPVHVLRAVEATRKLTRSRMLPYSEITVEIDED